MNNDDRELIVRLCTRAGMIMEDASVTAVTSAGLRGDQLKTAVEQLLRSAVDIKALIQAAQALL